MYKSIVSQNVDIKEGVLFLKKGQFYDGEVVSKYPQYFDIKQETKVEEKKAEIIEPAKTIEVTEVQKESKSDDTITPYEEDELKVLEQELKELEISEAQEAQEAQITSEEN